MDLELLAEPVGLAMLAAIELVADAERLGRLTVEILP